MGLAWMNDPLMDIDRCEHPNATLNITIAPIDYLQALCMMHLTHNIKFNVSLTVFIHTTSKLAL